MELEASDSNSFSMSTNETGKANPNVQIVQDGKVVKKVQKPDNGESCHASIAIRKRSNVIGKNHALNAPN